MVFIKIKNITLEHTNFVILFNNNKQKQFNFESVEKIFIQLENQKRKTYYAFVLLGILIILFFCSILSLNTLLIIAIALQTVSLIAIFYLKQYNLIIQLKNNEQHSYSLCSDAKFKILEKVRLIRTKIKEINFKELINSIVYE